MITSDLQLWLCQAPTDMRKSYDGLGAVVRQYFGRDPHCGDGFIFVNRRRTQMKCLYFERGGYCIWSKRLEEGRYARLGTLDAGPITLSATEFSALIEGFELVIRRRRKRAA